ncbi:MAG: hypothetical protein WBW04_10740 [Nitrolancea sp.]
MSTKTVAAKLQIKPGTTIWSSHPDRLHLVEPLPDDVTISDDLSRTGIALVYADDSASLRAILQAQQEHLSELSILWVVYPKANRTDINRDSLWPILSEFGMRPNSQVAIDDVWSALRFRPLKEGETPFKGGGS